MTETKLHGLPVNGYRAQGDEAVAKVNRAKQIEEEVLRLLDEWAADSLIDKRWLAIGRTDIEKGFMAVNRSVFRPGRAVLERDVQE